MDQLIVFIAKAFVISTYCYQLIYRGMDSFVRMQWFAFIYVIQPWKYYPRNIQFNNMKTTILEYSSYGLVILSNSVNDGSPVNDFLPEFMKLSEVFGDLGSILAVWGSVLVMASVIYMNYWTTKKTQSEIAANERKNMIAPMTKKLDELTKMIKKHEKTDKKGDNADS